MTSALEARWTRDEERWLHRKWGRIPRRRIAQILGRSEMAVQVRVRRLKIRPPTRWRHIMTNKRLAAALGIDETTCLSLLHAGKFPSYTVYLANRPILAVNIRRMCRWLAEPRNLYFVDIEKVRYPRFRRVVMRVCDRWLTVGEVCDLLAYTPSGVHKLISSGRLPAKRHGNWHVLRSDALLFREQLREVCYVGSS